MKRILLIFIVAAFAAVTALAHEPFFLVSSVKKTLKVADLTAVLKSPAGKVEKNTITYTGKEIAIVVITGPADDMLSYRIQGIRNPNLVVPSGATLKILFVNVDEDMRHDLRLGHIMGEFATDPGIASTVGTNKLTGKTADGTLQAEEIVIRAEDDGAYKYYCSVRGHAVGGMWGNIFVGTKPTDDVKSAPKTEHIHKPNEEMNQPAAKKPDEMPAIDMTKPAAMSDMDHSKTVMSSSVNLADPMSSEGSGTSWNPESSPVYARMKMFGDGSSLMMHGLAFLRYTAVGSSRDLSVAGKGGRSRVDAPSMFMLMYTRALTEKSQLGVRTMFSLDPLIERGWGYPLLFQSGESYGGQAMHDRQHPHEFISELAATYSYKFDEKQSLYFYAGLPGEPALGPVMYLHRLSGANIPDAPLGHHWQDATHITFGVLTAGYRYDKVKFEVSAFNGTEPDENRWAFDRPGLNSFSARLSFAPNKNWSFQISHGFLRNPERLEPEVKILRRTTASAIYNRSFGEKRNWASTFVWGQNATAENRSNSFLFESNYEFFKNAIFGRAEQVQKNAHELVLPSPHPEGNFWVQSYSVGYLRDVVKDKGIDVGLGTMATFGFNPSAVSSFYGGTRHAGWQIFIRLRASRMVH